MEQKTLSNGRVGTEPRFEVVVGSLPVAPTGRNGAHSASIGAEVVCVERL